MPLTVALTPSRYPFLKFENRRGSVSAANSFRTADWSVNRNRIVFRPDTRTTGETLGATKGPRSEAVSGRGHATLLKSFVSLTDLQAFHLQSSQD